MKKRLGVIGLLAVSVGAVGAIDYKELYFAEQHKTKAIKEQINKIKEKKDLYNDYFYFYQKNNKNYSFHKTITKQYLDYNYTISENKITDYNNRNLIEFHQDQIDEMVLSIKSNKPSVTVVVDKNYDVYINGELLTNGGEE